MVLFIEVILVHLLIEFVDKDVELLVNKFKLHVLFLFFLLLRSRIFIALFLFHELEGGFSGSSSFPRYVRIHGLSIRVFEFAGAEHRRLSSLRVS